MHKTCGSVSVEEFTDLAHLHFSSLKLIVLYGEICFLLSDFFCVSAACGCFFMPSKYVMEVDPLKLSLMLFDLYTFADDQTLASSTDLVLDYLVCQIKFSPVLNQNWKHDCIMLCISCN